MDVKLCIFVCLALAPDALQRAVHAGGVSYSRKGDGAPWGSYFSRGFGGFYSPGDFAPEPLPAPQLQHQRGQSHGLFDSPDEGPDDSQHTLSRADSIQSHIPAVPDTQSRNIPYDTKQQDWVQETQHDMQQDWTQDTQHDVQHDVQHDFQQDTHITQHNIFDDVQHDTDAHDFVTGYPPAKGHKSHVPDRPFHVTPPIFHPTLRPEPPVHHTTYQPETTTYQTTYHPDVQTTHHTTYQTDSPLQHTTYENEHLKEHTTHPTYETTTFPGTSDYWTTPYLGPREEGTCRPNPAAHGYPPGSKLLCTVELCGPKSIGSKTSKNSQQATLVCRPYQGCDDGGYTTEKLSYTTNDHGYTTDRPSYTTENQYTTEHPRYTTDHPIYTTENQYTTERPCYTTDKPLHTTEGDYQTTQGYTTETPYTTDEGPPPIKTHTTEHPGYPTEEHTEKPILMTEHHVRPTPPPHTTLPVEESTPCVRRPGVKGGVKGCETGVKGGVKGVKEGYHQPSWNSWSSGWNSWSDWEPRRQWPRREQTFWHLPRTQEKQQEAVRRPVWNGAWPSSFSAHADPAPAYVVF